MNGKQWAWVSQCQKMLLIHGAQCWGRSTEPTGAHHVSPPTLPARPPRPCLEHRGEDLHASQQDLHTGSQERLFLFLFPTWQPAGNFLATGGIHLEIVSRGSSTMDECDLSRGNIQEERVLFWVAAVFCQCHSLVRQFMQIESKSDSQEIWNGEILI